MRHFTRDTLRIARAKISYPDVPAHASLATRAIAPEATDESSHLPVLPALMTIIGWGETELLVFASQRTGTMKPETHNGDTFESVPGPDDQIICKGDSGGPGIDPATDQIIGVAHGVIGLDANCANVDRSIHMYPPRYRAPVMAIARQLLSDVCGPPPPKCGFTWKSPNTEPPPSCTNGQPLPSWRTFLYGYPHVQQQDFAAYCNGLDEEDPDNRSYTGVTLWMNNHPTPATCGCIPCEYVTVKNHYGQLKPLQGETWSEGCRLPQFYDTNWLDIDVIERTPFTGKQLLVGALSRGDESKTEYLTVSTVPRHIGCYWSP